MKPKMQIFFIGKRSRITRHKLLPVYLHAVIDGKRFEVATHQHIQPAQWSPFAGKVKGKSDTARQINAAPDLLKKKVYDYKDRA